MSEARRAEIALAHRDTRGASARCWHFPALLQHHCCRYKRVRRWDEEEFDSYDRTELDKGNAAGLKTYWAVRE